MKTRNDDLNDKKNDKIVHMIHSSLWLRKSSSSETCHDNFRRAYQNRLKLQGPLNEAFWGDFLLEGHILNFET